MFYGSCICSAVVLYVVLSLLANKDIHNSLLRLDDFSDNHFVYIRRVDVTESTVTICSPFCKYNFA